MDSVAYIQKQYASLKRQFDGVILDTTEEQVNWIPQGTGNSIGVTMVHMINGLDSAFQTVLRGKPQLWDSEKMGEKLGLSGPPGRVHGWDEIKSKPLPLEPILEYSVAVFKQVEEVVSGLKAEDLDRLVTFYGSERPAADAFIMNFSHVLVHTGEIAAIKGAIGVKGLPF